MAVRSNKAAPPLQDWLTDKSGIQPLLLTGEAGSGKSTLCQYIALQCLINPLSKGSFEIPLYIPLRFLVDYLKKHKVAALINVLAESKICFPRILSTIEKSLLSKALAKEKIIFLLDGADEMPDEKNRPKGLTDIFQELLAYPYHIMTAVLIVYLNLAYGLI